MSSILTDGEFDATFEKAAKAVLKQKAASVGFIQRRLGLPYTQAAMIMDKLEQEGYIGAYRGDKPRKILKDYATEYPEDYAADQEAEKEQLLIDFVDSLNKLAKQYGIIMEQARSALPPNLRNMEGDLLAQHLQYDHAKGEYTYIRWKKK
ncbi:DNA translocase SpoIIIE [compost metagenome]